VITGGAFDGNINVSVMVVGFGAFFATGNGAANVGVQRQKSVPICASVLSEMEPFGSI
jgi:hypothetical protein